MLSYARHFPNILQATISTRPGILNGHNSKPRSIPPSSSAALANAKLGWLAHLRRCSYHTQPYLDHCFMHFQCWFIPRSFGCIGHLERPELFVVQIQYTSILSATIQLEWHWHSDTVRSVGMPTEHSYFHGVRVIASGFGYLSTWAPRVPPILRWAELNSNNHRAML